jgi:hypothetical protein
VTINGNDLFKGFFFQARDAQTQEWIGSWVDSPNTNAIPECSSITHADNRDKTVSLISEIISFNFNPFLSMQQALFVWKAPADKSGQVFFT